MQGRIVHGAQPSLTARLIGVALSFATGMAPGGVAGRFGVDRRCRRAAVDRGCAVAALTADLAGAVGRRQSAGALMPNGALDLTAAKIYPWLLLPVFRPVLAFSFMRDGLREALDPRG